MRLRQLRRSIAAFAGIASVPLVPKVTLNLIALLLVLFAFAIIVSLSPLCLRVTRTPLPCALSKLVAKSTFTRWLSGESVYKTDSDGALSSELTVDDGMLLKHTALNVRKTSPLLTAEGEYFSASVCAVATDLRAAMSCAENKFPSVIIIEITGSLGRGEIF